MIVTIERTHCGAHVPAVHWRTKGKKIFDLGYLHYTPLQIIGQMKICAPG